jgi:hypothetical protein
MRTLLILASLSTSAAVAGEARTFLSHPPTRPLPTANARPLADGPHYFVDAIKGQDSFDGSKDRPWKTLAHAVSKLKPGDTLCLRGGTYYEHVMISAAGTPHKPITIRSYPGELAIVDGGMREFFESPDKAWEPYPDGVAGEYRSTKAYPELGAGEKGFNTHAYFGDSMIPMQGYRFLTDLRDPSMAWDIKNKVGDEDGGVYCGPGVFYDIKSGRFHARLAHTNLKALGDDNYRGQTDPRKLPLVVAAWKRGSTLTIRDSSDLYLQDLVVRGSVTATVDVSDSTQLVFDGLTVYCGQSAFRVRDTAGLRMLNTACRGIAAPWTFRGHLKYRSSEARIFSASGWSPTGRDNRDFELAYCEFTDSVDGVFIGNVKGVHFHHNLLDNISDDGIFLTSGTGYDGTTHGGDVFIYQNVLSRCLTTFAFGVGHGRQKTLASGRQTGSGVHIFRNVFDFRRPVMYQFPASPDGTEELPSKGRFASDHGGPAWEPMNIYHNTIIADGATGYDYGTGGFTGGLRGGNKRRVFNNLVVQLSKFPSTALIKPSTDLEIDGNLFWSAANGATEDFLARFRKAKNNVANLGVHDRFADPKFVEFSADWKQPLDLRLEKGSAAIDAGIAIPGEWRDIPKRDDGKPDIGALELQAQMWQVGVRGRLTMFGEVKSSKVPVSIGLIPFVDSTKVAYRADVKPAAIVEGYPELDAPVVEYALKREGIRVDRRERAWLPVADYAKYQMVVIAGDLNRAGIQPNRYSKDDLESVQKFLNDGGTLLLLRRGKRVFDWSPEGQKFMLDLTGRITEREKEPRLELSLPMHPWVKHLDPKVDYPWLKWRPDNDNAPLRVGKGEKIIASPGGTCLLYRAPVGKGQIIYMGWQTADSIPNGRLPSTVEAEKAFEEQVQILFNIVKDVYPSAK